MECLITKLKGLINARKYLLLLAITCVLLFIYAAIERKNETQTETNKERKKERKKDCFYSVHEHS